MKTMKRFAALLLVVVLMAAMLVVPANAAGGVGAKITPSAILAITPNGTHLINVKNQDAITKLIDMAPGVVNKLNFGSVFSGRNKNNEPEVKFEEETIVE